MTGPLATAFGDHIVAADQFIAGRLTKACARMAAAWPLSGLSGAAALPVIAMPTPRRL
jgi:hypothetical protein